MMRMGWTVSCDTVEVDGYLCCDVDQISGTKKNAKKEFIKSGWECRKGKWRCPSCVKENIPTEIK
mgnify:CR=1 FL=1